MLTVAAQVHLQKKIHSKIKTLPLLNFSESLNHLISFSISLSITDSPPLLADRRQLLAA
jgi:hypothetical protein